MNPQDQLVHIQLSEETARKAVKFGEQADKLQSNALFKAVILEGYFEKEAIRLVHMFADPNIDDDARKKIKLDMHAIGTLFQYLQNSVRFGEMAKQKLDALERMRVDEESGEGPSPEEEYGNTLGA